MCMLDDTFNVIYVYKVLHLMYFCFLFLKDGSSHIIWELKTLAFHYRHRGEYPTVPYRRESWQEVRHLREVVCTHGIVRPPRKQGPHKHLPNRWDTVPWHILPRPQPSCWRSKAKWLKESPGQTSRLRQNLRAWRKGQPFALRMVEDLHCFVLCCFEPGFDHGYDHSGSWESTTQGEQPTTAG